MGGFFDSWLRGWWLVVFFVEAYWRVGTIAAGKCHAGTGQDPLRRRRLRQLWRAPALHITPTESSPELRHSFTTKHPLHCLPDLGPGYWQPILESFG
ncbi:hypothetical protein F5Y04DRAFT_267048 [Hypomontagnella monticulosa]|nr:hypothetical protein F5Y04DRAFT_267048 [Hypomontagnella monticulosa]